MRDLSIERMRDGLRRLLMTFVVFSHSLNYSFSQSSISSPINWRDSLKTLNRQIEQNPRSTDLRLKKAAVNIELEQWDYAIEEYGRVLLLDSNNLAALFYRAYAYAHQRKYPFARNDYEQLLAKAPLHLEGRLGLATIYERMGRETDARDQMNLLVELFPDSAVVYVARAAFETQRKQYDMALFDWDEAIRLKPKNADYVVSRADILLLLGRRDEARQCLEEAVRRGVPRAQLAEWLRKCQ